MWLVYLLALVLGGGALLIQLLSGSHHGASLDHGMDHHPQEGPGLLSVRSAVYGLFTFGFVGGCLHLLDLARPSLALGLGLLAGAGGSLLAGMTFRSLSDPGASGEGAFHQAKGRRARVLLACAKGQRGKIRVFLQGQQVDMMATTDRDLISAGSEVVIEDVRDDVAHVVPAEEGT